MRKVVLAGILFLSLQACNNDTNNTDGGGEKDPSTVHPPSEAIPDSTALLNDSVIVPDTRPNNGSQVGASDSIQKQKQ